MLIAVIGSKYSAVPLGWVARVSGNPWVSQYGNVLECESKEDVAELFSGSREKVDIAAVPLPLRGALRYINIDPASRLIKTLTTSQTYNTGVTLPVQAQTPEESKFPGTIGLPVSPLPLACFLEPWAQEAIDQTPASAEKAADFLTTIRDPTITKTTRDNRLRRLLALAGKSGSSSSRPGGMGNNPVFFYNIGDTPINVRGVTLQRLEEAASEVFRGFSQFAEDLRVSTYFKLSKPGFSPWSMEEKKSDATNLETYLLAVDFMKDADGRWTITDVGGLGGGAIADIAFCNKVKPLYEDPAEGLAGAIATYGRSDINIVRPVFGMNVWEGEALQEALERAGVPATFSAGRSEALNVLTSVKPAPADVPNPLPTKEFADLYQVPLRTYALQQMRKTLSQEYDVGIPEVVELSNLVQRYGQKMAIGWLKENFGNWMIYRGNQFRTGPLPIADVVQAVNKPEGVVLEKMCPPWLQMVKRISNAGDLEGKYAAELRLYLGVRRDD